MQDYTTNSAPGATPGAGHSGPARPAGWERETLEKLAFATLREQRAARRWRIGFRFMWLGYFIAIAWFIFGGMKVAETSYGPHTALIEVSGPIASDSEANAQDITEAMAAAFADPGAKAVVLLINSPGGSPVQAGIIHDEILRLKALHGKPVYAVVEETCASAAYYVAAAADNIYVDKASLVGSIGVLMNGFGFTGLMDKVGVERRLLTAGENKGFLDPFSPESPEQRAMAQDMLNEIHAQFIGVVERGRGDRLKRTEDLFSGKVWSGESAVRLGLADGMANLNQVARDVVQAETIIDYTARENVAERLARRFGAGMGESALKLAERWSLELR